MKKIYLLIFSAMIVLAVFFIFNAEKVEGTEAVYYKSISCGCCDAHSKYLNSKGFSVKVNNLQSIDSIKSDFGVPYELRSCHTVIIDDYFVEGHIPLEAINKLLEEKPNIRGIAMPGMPSGSPGMPGAKTGFFKIYSVNHDGSYGEFMEI
ncbi:MAG: DUF411 domain-containing protein [Candidatus Pacearchaeota archaeon]